jgi:hypothetical protein
VRERLARLGPPPSGRLAGYGFWNGEVIAFVAPANGSGQTYFHTGIRLSDYPGTAPAGQLALNAAEIKPRW